MSILYLYFSVYIIYTIRIKLNILFCFIKIKLEADSFFNEIRNGTNMLIISVVVTSMLHSMNGFT